MDKSLAPGFARTTYTGLSGVHHAILPLNIDPSAVAGADPTVTLKDGTTQLASAALNAYWDIAQAFLNTDQNIGLCEIYKVNVSTGEGTFLWGFDLGMAGSSVGTPVEMSMATLSFKLINGRTAKVVFLDGPNPVNVKIFPPWVGGTNLDALTDYLTGDTSPLYGRGNSYPFAAIAYTAKTSDALRKREGLA